MNIRSTALLSVAIWLLVARDGGAQWRADARLTLPAHSSTIRVLQSPSSNEESGRALDRFAGRALVGAIGWLGGAFLGAVIGLDGTSSYDCGESGIDGWCRDVLIGGGLGSALASAAYALDDDCTFGSRLLWSLGGSAIGTGVGYLAREDFVFAIPAGAAFGGAGASLFCR